MVNQPMNPDKQMVALTPEQAQLLGAAPALLEATKRFLMFNYGKPIDMVVMANTIDFAVRAVRKAAM